MEQRIIAPEGPEGPEGELAALLADDEPLTAGYKPSLPIMTFYSGDGLPQLYALRDVEVMLSHPHVKHCMEVYKSGIFGAEFEVQAEKPEVQQFCMQQIQRFWDAGMPQIQLGYDYGWIGAENIYTDKNGPLEWERLVDFCPMDTHLLTKKHEMVGVRVKHVLDKQDVDLFTRTEHVPGKAIWYPHRPRFQQWYGRTQLHAAWRPWKRLATTNGMEFVIDQAFYRFGVSGPVMRYPPSSYLRTASNTQPIQDARSMARQYVEQSKAGGGIALPSTKYPQSMGGDYQWTLEFPDHTINCSGLIEGIEYLLDEIAYGIGVPPELMEASATGSGYSGRQIPLEAFMMMQQQHAEAILECFLHQVLKPLVYWNFGETKWGANVKNLLATRMAMGNKNSMGQPGQPGQPGQQQPRQPGQPGQEPPLPGAGGAPPEQPGSQPDPLKSSYTGPHGGKGWRDGQGRVHYGEFSLNGSDRIRTIADRILAAVRAEKQRAAA